MTTVLTGMFPIRQYQTHKATLFKMLKFNMKLTNNAIKYEKERS